MIPPLQAALLGVVEGLTEFLPISSTGHLILASAALNLHGEAVKTFEVVIQAGALGAVAGLYRGRVQSMWRGVRGQDARGRQLFLNLVVSFLPAAVAGIALHHLIKARLFSAGPVAAALAVGGVLMVGLDRWLLGHADRLRTLGSITWREALIIGCAQCLSLWPGTSRAMVTMVGGMALGLPAVVAAEYSFLLALPTLGAATLLDTVSGGHLLVQSVGWRVMGCGFAASAVVAALTISGFVRYLTRRGLAPFGWYRLGVAAVVWIVARSQA